MESPAENGRNNPWHAQTVPETAAQLNVSPADGLSREEVNTRLDRYGENRLTEKPPRSKWLTFFDQFKSVLIMVLVGAAVLAGAIGDIRDAVVILFVVLLNAVLGFWQEHRAETTLASLKKMLSPTARVRRAGQEEEIEARELVPGDIVLLEAGDRVPADGRLLVSHNIEVDEAPLTGESRPVAKKADAKLSAETPLADRHNLLFMNTVLTRGRAEMVVTATGMATEMGRLSDLLSEAEPGPTPLQRQLNNLGHRLALIAGAIIAGIFILGLLRNKPLMETLLTSIALAVAAIPEGLPAVVTVTLALGMHRMAQQRAIVKKLAAVETLGCTTVICSDKTGTLTLNQMTARIVVYQGRRFKVSGEGYDNKGEIQPEDDGGQEDLSPLLEAAALANDSRIRDGELIGDPTEGALLSLAGKGGISIEKLAERLPRIAEIPFDSEQKFMATFHEDGDRILLLAKGALDVLLERSRHQLDMENRDEPASADQQWWQAENEKLAGKAMRVMALASRSIPTSEFDPDGDLAAEMHDLTMLGLVGIIDPPRSEAREALALCKRAGIRVKMITGDHKVTAAAIANSLGMGKEVMEGRELDMISSDRLSEEIDRVTVFARVAPEHKVKIVRSLKKLGHVVAVTGDGVNDAPALKNADIGVAMGITGTEVSKDAATMVLTDDNFATIVGAVKRGRTIYENIVKFIRFQLSTNMGAIQTVLYSSLLGWPTPFTAIQILWINIIMDGPPAMSLGVEPERQGIMDEAPRSPEASILTARRLLGLFIYGLTMAAGTLGIFFFTRSRGLDHALTLSFTTFVLFQFFNIFNARAEKRSAFNRLFFRNRYLWLSLAGVISLQILVVHWGPAQSIFDTTALSFTDWGLAALVASSVLVLNEARKLVSRFLFTS